MKALKFIEFREVKKYVKLREGVYRNVRSK